MRRLLCTLCLGLFLLPRAHAEDTAPDGGAPRDGGAERADAGVPDAGPPANEADGGVPFDPFAESEPVASEPAAAATVVAPGEDAFTASGFEVVGVLEREQREAPGSVIRLDEKRLEQMNYDDAHQVLSQVPGVYVRQEDGYGLRPNVGMRGADPDRSKKVTLLEDGVLFGPAPYSAPAAYYFPLLTRMTGVEVYKGVPAIRFGPQSIGGALDLATRAVPRDGQAMGLDASLGNTYFTKLHAYTGYGTERWGLLGEGVHTSSSGFKEIDGGGDTGFSKQELMAKGRVSTSAGAHNYHEGELKLGYAREESRETYLGLSDADFRDRPLRRYATTRLDDMQNHREQIELRHLWGLGDHFELETVAYRHDFWRRWNRFDHLVSSLGAAGPDVRGLLANPQSNPAAFGFISGALSSADSNYELVLAGNKREFVAQGVQTVSHFDFESGPLHHDVELGLRFHQDQIRRHHTASDYEMVRPDEDATAALTPQRSAGPTLLTANNGVSTLALAAHLFYGLTYRRLTLTPGARLEVIRATYTEHLGAGGDAKFTPNVFLMALGARYALTDELSAIAGVQQGMTPVAPDAGSLGVSSIPASRQVERANNYEAGVRYLNGLGQAQLVGFVSDYSNIVAPCEVGCGFASDVTFGGGSARIYGLELAADRQVRLPAGFALPLRGSYTYTHALFSETFRTTYPPWAGDDGEVRSGDFMPYIPPHQFSLGAGATYQERAGVELALTFMDRMRELAGRDEPETGIYTDRYALLDVNAFYQILDQLQLYVKGDNLTNNQPLVSRLPFGARPNKPLLVQVGVKWTR